MSSLTLGFAMSNSTISKIFFKNARKKEVKKHKNRPKTLKIHYFE